MKQMQLVFVRFSINFNKLQFTKKMFFCQYHFFPQEPHRAADPVRGRGAGRADLQLERQARALLERVPAAAQAVPAGPAADGAQELPRGHRAESGR